MILKEMKALANDKRLKILFVLSYNEFCQIHISELTGLGQVDASRSLKQLVDTGFVATRKVGNRVLFSLTDKLELEYGNVLTNLQVEYSDIIIDIDMEQFIQTCETFKE